MKKILYSLIAFFAFSSFGNAQSRYVFIDFKDAQKPGVQNDYLYPESIVAKAISDKMEKLGYKGKETKGYKLYKSVSLPELGTASYDIYFKIDRKSRKEKDATSVTMLISAGNENFITEAENLQTINNAKSFLDNLIPGIAAFDLEQQIKDQEEALKKAERKYKNLQDDQDDLQKRRRKIEEQLSDNAKDQKNQQDEIEKQRQIFETLKLKRK